MSKIIWFVVFLLGAVLFVKPLRERARPQIEYVINPVYRWDARNRVNEIYRVIQREVASGGGVPYPRDFQQFLAQREGPQAALDPWGQPFYLDVGKRSFQVSSPGPDRTPGTVDDIHSKTETLRANTRYCMPILRPPSGTPCSRSG
jgi:hypothetical protein